MESGKKWRNFQTLARARVRRRSCTSCFRRVLLVAMGESIWPPTSPLRDSEPQLLGAERTSECVPASGTRARAAPARPDPSTVGVRPTFTRSRRSHPALSQMRNLSTGREACLKRARGSASIARPPSPPPLYTNKLLKARPSGLVRLDNKLETPSCSFGAANKPD